MPLSLHFKGNQVGPKFRAHMGDLSKRVREATREAAHDASREILQRGRADIASAGNFGSRWTGGLHAEVSGRGENTLLQVSHDVSYFMVHQRGALIRGRPLLWIPLSFAEDAQGVMARNYPGGLFRVDRKGSKAPLLLSISTGEPKYFGKSQVRIPKRFHIIEIIRDVAQRMRDFYRARMSR